jgi:hypothetical protein
MERCIFNSVSWPTENPKKNGDGRWELFTVPAVSKRAGKLSSTITFAR